MALIAHKLCIIFIATAFNLWHIKKVYAFGTATCVDGENGCATCLDGTWCSTCLGGFLKMPDYTCKPCTEGCMNCNGNLKACIVCEEGYRFNSTTSLC